eukprot:940283-Rhodomonas_salina.1
MACNVVGLHRDTSGLVPGLGHVRRAHWRSDSAVPPHEGDCRVTGRVAWVWDLEPEARSDWRGRGRRDRCVQHWHVGVLGHWQVTILVQVVPGLVGFESRVVLAEGGGGVVQLALHAL